MNINKIPTFPDPSSILPMMRNAAYVRSFHSKLALAKVRGNDPADIEPKLRPFTREIFISYEIAEQGKYSPLSATAARRLGISDDSLHQLALNNLEREVEGNLKIYRFYSFSALYMGSELEASTLLLKSLWDEIEKGVCGELRVAVPGRKMISFVGTQDTGEFRGKTIPAETCLAMMAGSADLIYQEELHDAQELSHHMLVRTESGWDTQVPTLWEMCKDVDISMPSVSIRSSS